MTWPRCRHASGCTEPGTGLLLLCPWHQEQLTRLANNLQDPTHQTLERLLRWNNNS